ncbi:MAG: hypothetical protein Q9195_000722 [Heterodermia aff. obscurata]
MDQLQQQTQRPVDVQCLELRWTNQAIGQYCKILNLKTSIASYALHCFQQLCEHDAKFQKDRHAVIAASIFVACRYFKRSIRYSTILTLVRVNPESGFIMLLSVEMALPQSSGVQSLYSRVLRMPEYMLASNAPSMQSKSIGFMDGSRVIVTNDYNESDPPMRNFCCFEPAAMTQDVSVGDMRSEHHVASRDILTTQMPLRAKTDDHIKNSQNHTENEHSSVNPRPCGAGINEDADWNFVEFEELAATDDSSEQWSTVVEPAKPRRTWAGALRRGLFGSPA